jgi:hypothetical protein
MAPLVADTSLPSAGRVLSIQSHTVHVSRNSAQFIFCSLGSEVLDLLLHQFSFFFLVPIFKAGYIWFALDLNEFLSTVLLWRTFRASTSNLRQILGGIENRVMLGTRRQSSHCKF